jgi:hypothetical protein
MERQPPTPEDRMAAITAQINTDIEDSFYERRAVMDLTAKRIAELIHPGSGPLYDLATTGAIPEEIYAELAAARNVVPERTLWIDALDDYCLGRLRSDPIPDWNELGDDKNQ